MTTPPGTIWKPLATGAILLSAMPAFAPEGGAEQAVDRWHDRLGINGLLPIAPIAGLDVMGSSENDLLWMRDPVSGTLIAGYAFDGDGQNLNSVNRVVSETRIEDFLAISPGARPDRGIVAPAPGEISGILDGLSPDKRKIALENLVARMRGVDNQAEFDIEAREWADELTTGLDTAADEMTLLQAMSRSAFLQVGNESAPLFWVLVDPACKTCGNAVDAALAAAGTGKFTLRIVLAPFSGSTSSASISRILNSSDPVKALASAFETPSLPEAVIPDLPGDLEIAFEMNRSIAASLPNAELPIFAWRTGAGAHYAATLPDDLKGVFAAP